MVAEVLAIVIRNCGLAGIKVLDRQLIISQLADDTTLFLKDETQIPITGNNFSKASGLRLNVKKCELLALKDYPLQSLCNIKVKK